MSELALRDPGRLARLEAVKVDEAAPLEVFMRMTEHRQTLREIARAWGVSVGPFVEWYTTEHAERYDAALKVLAADYAHEAVAIADEQAEVVKPDGSTYDPDVPRDKLRVEARLKLVERWDRARYGAKDQGPAGGITVQIDRSCGGAVRVGVKDAGGNVAAIEVSGAEASA